MKKTRRMEKFILIGKKMISKWQTFLIFNGANSKEKLTTIGKRAKALQEEIEESLEADRK